MNVKKYWLAVTAAFIITASYGISIGIATMDQFVTIVAMSRNDAEIIQLMPLTLLSNFIITMIIGYFYIKLRKTGDIIEGAKIGALFGILMSAVTWMYFSILSIDIYVIIVDSFTNIMIYTVTVMILSFIYKPKE
ncbi:MAG: hypothetical protein P8H03_01675 [Emcibacteraceae bacterium]|nr:hypothetical protein [Emcibacteraceae bacterium]MDG1997323.1 hypothetical protein [Emcibacteraceae bacterium]